MNEAIKTTLCDYLEYSSYSNYLALTEAVAGSEVYEPYSEDFQTARSLIKQEKYAEALEIMVSMGLARAASPSFHWSYSWLAMKLEDKQGEGFHHVLAVKLGHQILSTGEGTSEEPYKVLWLEDEYDVLASLEKQRLSQRLISSGGRDLDVIQCTDESEVWFDVTIPFSHLRKGSRT